MSSYENNSYIYGIICALIAPFSMVIGFMIWGDVWKGSAFALNLFKCTFASILFLFITYFNPQSQYDLNNLDQISLYMLMLSSFLGIIIGDIAWIFALQIIGARKVIAFDILKPFLSAVFGHFLLNESLSIIVIFGLLISSTGIMMVSLQNNSPKKEMKEKNKTFKKSQNLQESISNYNIIGLERLPSSDSIVVDEDIEGTFSDDRTDGSADDIYNLDNSIELKGIGNQSPLYSLLGYIAAILNVLFDSYGFVITKQYGSYLNTWEINLIRFGFASLFMLGISLFSYIISKINSKFNNQSKSSNNSRSEIEFSVIIDNSLHSQRSDNMSEEDLLPQSNTSPWFLLPYLEMTFCDWIKISIGVIFVTFISTALTNYAVFQIDLGLCMTLTSLGPIYTIPILYIMKSETSNVLSICGAVLSVIGIIVLAFSNDLSQFDYYDWFISPSSNTTIPTTFPSFNNIPNYYDYEVKELPGWNDDLPSKQYSGFVNVNNMNVHYWLVESEGNPLQDPLVLWFNGGPGSSSIYGNLLEIGPFRLSDLSYEGEYFNETGIPELVYNEYGWMKVANLLFLSMPPPVGFSYCNDKVSSIASDCGSWNDSSTALITYLALKQWLRLFPHFQLNDMYITGESYAGIYIPELIKNILREKSQEDIINLKGFAIGDACTPPAICSPIHSSGPYWNWKFLFGKAGYSIKLQEMITFNCNKDDLLDGNLSDICLSLGQQVIQEVGGYWDYAYYDDCWYTNELPISNTSMNSTNRRLATATSTKLTYHTGIDGYTCGGLKALFDWLERDVVKLALHIPMNAKYYQVDNAIGFPYVSEENDLIQWYKDIIQENKLRILIYNGDTDPGINTFKVQEWIQELQLNKTEKWHAWTLDNCQRVGGYVIRYQNNFDFLTIKDSGHMVPLFKPKASLEFITRWLRNESFQRYDNTCLQPISRQLHHDISLISLKDITNRERILKRQLLLARRKLKVLKGESI